MTEIVKIYHPDEDKEDFIIKEPTKLIIDCTLEQIPKVKIMVKIDFENAERFHDFIKEVDVNYYRTASIKTINKNLFKYYYEFHECSNVLIKPIDIEQHEIEFSCIYYDFVRKDTGLKIQKFEPFKTL